MKTLLKSSVIALVLFGMTAISRALPAPIPLPLIGQLASTDFFGEYEGSFRGSLPHKYFTMEVFPNGFVEGYMGSSGGSFSVEFFGRVGNDGRLSASFSAGGRDYAMTGIISKTSRSVTLQVKQAMGGATVGFVSAGPVSREDFAPRSFRLNGLVFEIWNNFDTDYSIFFGSNTFSTGGFGFSDAIFGSGTYTYSKIQLKNMGQVRLTFNGGGETVSAQSAPVTQTFTIFFFGSDFGVLYDIRAGRFYFWESFEND